jgi:hypothetical protein
MPTIEKTRIKLRVAAHAAGLHEEFELYGLERLAERHKLPGAFYQGAETYIEVADLRAFLSARLSGAIVEPVSVRARSEVVA